MHQRCPIDPGCRDYGLLAKRGVLGGLCWGIVERRGRVRVCVAVDIYRCWSEKAGRLAQWQSSCAFRSDRTPVKVPRTWGDGNWC
jgi:hypothetical protein